MNESQEELFARRILESAHQMSWITCSDPGDVDAATAAILKHALELATPDSSDAGRARLFCVEDLSPEQRAFLRSDE